MMWSSAREIAAGDVIIVWLTRDLVQPLVVTPGSDFNSKFGNYRHSDLVGIPYGSKVASRTGKGFIHVLRPTPELWTLALPHRTQILYLADIAFVVSYLNIKPGSRVIEAGTGSGSFSHSVARTIGPSGHLWSYEFHEVRARKAREEFKRHGMDDIVVTLTHRNVCKDGFTVIDTVDSVFLDLPAPWDAVEHAKKALRKDRQTRICCFSPCMEQVLRTVSALNEAGFTEITMYETLLRPHDVSSVPALLTVGEISEKLKQSERRREDKRLRQIAANQAIAAKRKREEREVEQEGEEKVAEEPDESVESKRVRIDEGEGPADEGETGLQPMEVDLVELPASTLAPTAEAAESKSAPEPLPTRASTIAAMSTARSTPVLPPSDRISVSKVFPEVRGHTSYLTFASLVPFAPASSASPESTSENGDAHVQEAHAAIGPLAS